ARPLGGEGWRRTSESRDRAEDLACLRRILGDLRLQRVDAGEFALGPELLDQRHAQMTAIEIAGEIEEMHLQPQIAAAEGRARAEIGDRVVPARPAVLLDRRADGIDAGGRSQVIVQKDVGGGKADGAAALIAALDPAVDLPEAAEQRRRLARSSGDEVLADAGRGIERAAGGPYGIDDADAEAERRAALGEQRRVAAPLMAEDEIIAHHRMAEAQPADQHLVDEGLGAALGEIAIEMEREQQIDAERLDAPRLHAEGGQAKGRVLRPEDAARMRLEGEDGRGHAQAARDRTGLADDPLMAEMDAVEVALRDHRAALAGGHPVVAENAHRAENIARKARRIVSRAPAPSPGHRHRSPPSRRRGRPSSAPPAPSRA